MAALLNTGPVVFFALQREAAPFLRAARHRRRIPGAPALAWHVVVQPGSRELIVLVTGVGARRTASALGWLFQHTSPSRVIAAGFAGGLRPGFRAGDVLHFSEVVDEAGTVWDLPPSAIASANSPLETTRTQSESQRPVLAPPSRFGKGDGGLGLRLGHVPGLGHGQNAPDTSASQTPPPTPPRNGEGRPAATGSPTVRDGLRLLTATHLVTSPVEKQTLAARFNADAVDMESATVARLCAERGVPLTCVRALSDDADMALSPALVRLLAGGRVSPTRLAATLLRSPRLMFELIALARNTGRAARNLAAEVHRLLVQSDGVAEAGEQRASSQSMTTPPAMTMGPSGSVQ